jgi:EAL domain-containing protein (putative c-di-GMP-specific phosphodiesterase class I)
VSACSPGPCACRSVPVVEDRSLLAIHSATTHTLTLIADLVDDDVEVSRRGRLLQLTGANMPRLLLEIDAALTATERVEARAVLLDAGLEGDELLGAAMAASPVGQLAARVRYEHLTELVGRPERFRARYQQIIDLDDGGIVGYEALLRATDDADRELSAGELFGAASAGGWTNTLDRIGRETAIRDAAPWLGDQRLFINFVPTSVYRPEVCLATTTAAANRYGVDLRQLVFEVVETHRTEDIRHLTTVVEHYRSRGAAIALDDVGSGYSSLNLIAKVRPDIVKIDMELVQALPDPSATTIVRAVIELSHELGAAVIAEGIETEQQLEIVQQLGADWGQGYIYGRPALPSEGPAAAALAADEFRATAVATAGSTADPVGGTPAAQAS